MSNNKKSLIKMRARDEKATKVFSITIFSWSPDSYHFIVSQSDMTVWLYYVGPSNSSRTIKIMLRFTHTSQILCTAWPLSKCKKKFKLF